MEKRDAEGQGDRWDMAKRRPNWQMNCPSGFRLWKSRGLSCSFPVNLPIFLGIPFNSKIRNGLHDFLASSVPILFLSSPNCEIREFWAEFEDLDQQRQNFPTFFRVRRRAMSKSLNRGSTSLTKFLFLLAL